MATISSPSDAENRSTYEVKVSCAHKLNIASFFYWHFCVCLYIYIYIPTKRNVLYAGDNSCACSSGVSFS
jgi:N-acetylmuramoyl-L-alanine amidase CwlA